MMADNPKKNDVFLASRHWHEACMHFCVRIFVATSAVLEGGLAMPTNEPRRLGPFARTAILRGITALSLLGIASTTVWAQILMDPLHGQCNGSVGCIDNGTNTPLGNATQFSFSISSGPQTGDLVLDILVPDNQTASPSPPSIMEIFPTSTTKTTIQQVPPTPGTWTSGTLAAFLGISASPSNNIGAFLPATQALDPGATGFDVFQADFGTVLIGANPATEPVIFPDAQSPIFDVVTGLPLGSYIVGFCESGCTAPPAVATANSGALLVDEVVPRPVPEPGMLLVFGTGLLALGLLRRRWR